MPRSITLFHCSDLHFGAEDRSALAWFGQEVKNHRPDAVICTGDITMRATTREFASAARWLETLDVPITIEPGNHDMPYYGEMIERLRRPYARFEAFRASVHRSVNLSGVALIPLRTIAPAQWRLNWSKGRVGASALGRACADLNAIGHSVREDEVLKLVACHHPLVGAAHKTAGSTRGGQAALAALAQAGADVVLSGHVHDPFDRTITLAGRNLRLIGAGTLSERLRSSPPSYNRLDWTPGQGLQNQVHSLI